MPLSFNPDSYTNQFPGEIIESDVMDSRSNGNQFLRLVIATMDHTGQKTQQAVQCYMKDCTAVWIHRHQPYLWEDTQQSSWLFKFLDSLNKKGHVNTKDPRFNHKELVGKVFMWEPVENKGGGAKKDDGTRYDQTFFFVAGPFEKTEAEDEPEPLVKAASVNGTSNVKIDPDLTLAIYINGKSYQEITNAMQELMTIFDAQYVVNDILGKNGFARLIERGLVLETDGRYKTSDQVQVLIGDSELRGK